MRFTIVTSLLAFAIGCASSGNNLL